MPYFPLINGTVGHNTEIWKFRNVCTCNLQVQGGFTLVKSAKNPFLCIVMGNLTFAMPGPYYPLKCLKSIRPTLVKCILALVNYKYSTCKAT